MKPMANVAALSMLIIYVVLLPCKCYDARDGHPISPAKTIKTAAGDIFDCVDIYEQPAFLHPSLKDHQILMKPNVVFEDFSGEEGLKADDTIHIELEGGGCPQGTVPIHRLPEKNSTGSATPHHADHPNANIDGQNYRKLYAVRKAKRRYYYGASSKINVYGVHPIGSDQLSSGMIWLRNEDVPSTSQVPVIQAGWSVYPELHRDYKTRLTAAWSRDGDQRSCFNHQCPGFVQVSPRLALGADIWPLSTVNGPQYYMYIHMYKDDKNNWWLACGDVENVVGYWPAELFGNFDHASGADFGGCVRCQQGQDCPPMGDGHRPWEQEWDTACSMRYVQVIGPDHRWGGLGNRKHTKFMTIRKCYSLGFYISDIHAYQFSFGGPVCPSSEQPPIT